MTTDSSARPLVMGVLNVTPDSFSDGGRWHDHDAAVRHGLDLVVDGADLVDVGGESTRPGSVRVPMAEEQRRILPVVERLAGEGVVLSIDTMNADTARRTVELGARYVNDVSAGLADPDMLDTVADGDAVFIVSHWRGLLTPDSPPARYDDVVEEVVSEIGQRLDAARAAGIGDERLVVDPGLGFSKNGGHNWALLAAVDRLRSFGLPVLLGTSRKRFIAETLPGALRAAEARAETALHARDAATAAIAALLAESGVWGFRVHDAAAARAALEVGRRLAEARRAREAAAAGHEPAGRTGERA
jgi:dihydropteroate synthase